MTLNSTSDRSSSRPRPLRGVVPGLAAGWLLCAGSAMAQPDDRPGPPPRGEPPARHAAEDAWPDHRGDEALRLDEHARDHRGGDRDGDGPPRRRGGRADAMTEAEAIQAFPIIELLQPDLADELRELGERDPRQLRETMQRRFPGVRYLIDLQERDPETYQLRIRDIQLNRETRDLAKSVQAALAADREDEADDLTETLEERVTEHFEVRQALRERELDVLRERIERMQEELEDRADERDDLIEERVEELVGKGQGPSF